MRLAKELALEKRYLALPCLPKARLLLRPRFEIQGYSRLQKLKYVKVYRGYDSPSSKSRGL